MRERRLEPRIYVYKCINDDGTAPCVDNRLFSLTICKPAIRRTAPLGSIIFAFGGNGETPANRLVYIAEITDRIEDGRYFVRRRFRQRQDRVYKKMKSGRYQHRGEGWTHDYPANLDTDIGTDGRNAVALVSEDFRYFGERGTDSWKRSCPQLKKHVEVWLTQGHRVVRHEGLRRELLALKNDIWCRYPTRKVLGKPLHGETLDSCKPKKRVKSC